MTVAEMLERISSRELAEWMAFEEVFGTLGPERGDLLAGIVAAAPYNARRTKKADPITKPSDLMPVWDRKPQQQSWQDQLALAKQLNAIFGGTTNGG